LRCVDIIAHKHETCKQISINTTYKIEMHNPKNSNHKGNSHAYNKEVEGQVIHQEMKNTDGEPYT